MRFVCCLLSFQATSFQQSTLHSIISNRELVFSIGLFPLRESWFLQASYWFASPNLAWTISSEVSMRSKQARCHSQRRCYRDKDSTDWTQSCQGCCCCYLLSSSNRLDERLEVTALAEWRLSLGANSWSCYLDQKVLGQSWKHSSLWPIKVATKWMKEPWFESQRSAQQGCFALSKKNSWLPDFYFWLIISSMKHDRTFNLSGLPCSSNDELQLNLDSLLHHLLLNC